MIDGTEHTIPKIDHGDQFTELFAEYDTATTIERGNFNGIIRETIELGSPHGPSFAMVEWQYPPHWVSREVVGKTEEVWRTALPNYGDTLIGNRSKGRHKKAQAMLSHDFGPAARLLGMDYAILRPDTTNAQAEVLIMPSPKRLNTVGQKIFDRKPEAGYPKFSDLSGQEGSKRSLKARPYLSELAAGRIPIGLRIHDTLIHFGYNVVPANVFLFVKERAANELEKPYDWDHDLPEDSSASELIRAFDTLTGQLTERLLSYGGPGDFKDIHLLHQKFIARVGGLTQAEADQTGFEFAQATLDEINRMITIAKEQSLAKAA